HTAEARRRRAAAPRKEAVGPPLPARGAVGEPAGEALEIARLVPRRHGLAGGDVRHLGEIAQGEIAAAVPHRVEGAHGKVEGTEIAFGIAVEEEQHALAL